MNNQSSITALMSRLSGRSCKNKDHPVFTDHLAKELMTAEEYTAVQNYIQALKAAVLTGTKQYVILGCRYGYICFREGEFLQKHQVFDGGIIL